MKGEYNEPQICRINLNVMFTNYVPKHYTELESCVIILVFFYILMTS